MPLSRPAPTRALVPLFSITIFLGAALLFVLEPMFARMVLPLLGGSPSVWMTTVLVFQALLLAGYGYAHLAISRLGPRRHVLLHVPLMIPPILLLPIAVPLGWLPPSGSNPAPWLIAVMGVSVALPFLLISSLSPALQRWFSSTGHRMAHDPYFLFRASNLGSMVGLLAYPLVLEPALRLAEQSRLWSLGYVLLTLLVASCAAMVWYRSSRTSEDHPEASPIAESEEVPLTVRRRVRWVMLAFVPSSLMLGVTNFLTTDISPIPLLWVVPLAIYLISFVVAFGAGYGRRRDLVIRAMPILVLTVVATMLLRAPGPLWLLIPLHLLVLFAACLMCHGELAIDRPPPRSLTSFYLWISFGGVLGGAFNALIAPVLFNSFIEYPLAIAAACAMLPAIRERTHATRASVLDVAIPAGIGAAILVSAIVARQLGSTLPQVVVAVILSVLAVGLRARPLRFALAVGALLLAGTSAVGGGAVLTQARSFFGAYRVTSTEGFRELVDGTTLHGAQSLAPSHRLEPTSYFTATGPVGDVFEAWVDRPVDGQIGVIGLGTGSLACHGRAGERWTFFEIDPIVEDIARDRSMFTYLRDCSGQNRVVLGDGRLSLERWPQGSLDLLIVDAFSSDAIPVHLITREALALYRSTLSPDGLLLFHISNRYLDLQPVLGRLADDAGIAALVKEDRRVTEDDQLVRKVPSDWLVMTRDAAVLDRLRAGPGWRNASIGQALWTDDHADVIGVVDWT